ncbi:MAG: hypothetical protein MMC23_002576 [Stictis urceolatum]|nr:hypothetical protein [Stictis urceolata]
MPAVPSADLDVEPPMRDCFRNPSMYLSLQSTTTFHDLYACLAGKTPSNKSFFLCSNYGWSVFLDTTEDKDPALVRRDVVHIHKGTPVGSKKNEHKDNLQDGSLSMQALLHVRARIVTGRDFIPRALFSIVRKNEYWSTEA